MAFKFFGWRFGRDEDINSSDSPAIVPPTPLDGALEVEIGPAATTATLIYDLEGTFNNEVDLINKYRDMALYAPIDHAINEVVNDMIVMEDNAPPVKLEFGNEFKFSDNLKEKINIEFKNVLRLLSFNSQAYDIAKRWYTDGKLYYQAIIDKTNTTQGIQEVRYIDPRNIKKVREVIREKDKNGVDVVKDIDEYYIYSRSQLNSTNSANYRGNSLVNGIKIHKDDIIFCHSGCLNASSTMVLSFLHKAIRPYNQLKSMEDALVIYRITRAPERRIFNIDLGEMPPAKAKQYFQEMITNYRNKLIYNTETGEIRDDRRHSTMMEDFWFPVRGDKKSEVTTLPGGQNLSEIADIEYFQKNLYKALGIPVTRLDPETGFNMGRASEITREELKFAAFIIRLRKRFSHLFDELLKRQLILKKITTEEDWESLKENIYYNFRTNSFFSELKYAELMKERLELLDAASGYAPEDSKYFSREFMQKKILRFSDDEITEIEAELKGIETKDKTPEELEKELSAPPEENPEGGEDLNLEPKAGEETPQPETPAEPTAKPEKPTEEEGYDLFGYSAIDDVVPEEIDYENDILLEEDGGGEGGDAGGDFGGDAGGDFSGDFGGDYFDTLGMDADFDPSGDDPTRSENKNNSIKKDAKHKKGKGKIKKSRGLALMFHNLGKNYNVTKPKSVKGKSKKTDDK